MSRYFSFFFLKIRSNKGRVSKPQSRNPSVKGVGRGIPLSSVYFSPFVMTSRPLSQGWFGAFQKASDFEYTGFPKPKPKLCKLWNCTNDTSDHRKSIPLFVDFGKIKLPSRTMWSSFNSHCRQCSMPAFSRYLSRKFSSIKWESSSKAQNHC